MPIFVLKLKKKVLEKVEFLKFKFQNNFMILNI